MVFDDIVQMFFDVFESVHLILDLIEEDLDHLIHLLGDFLALRDSGRQLDYGLVDFGLQNEDYLGLVFVLVFSFHELLLEIAFTHDGFQFRICLQESLGEGKESENQVLRLSFVEDIDPDVQQVSIIFLVDRRLQGVVGVVLFYHLSLPFLLILAPVLEFLEFENGLLKDLLLFYLIE